LSTQGHCSCSSASHPHPCSISQPHLPHNAPSSTPFLSYNNKVVLSVFPEYPTWLLCSPPQQDSLKKLYMLTVFSFSLPTLNSFRHSLPSHQNCAHSLRAGGLWVWCQIGIHNETLSERHCLKTNKQARHWWLIPIILVIWKAEIGRITVQGQPGQKKVYETLSQQIAERSDMHLSSQHHGPGGPGQKARLYIKNNQREKD
jgi:hypothetical protein